MAKRVAIILTSIILAVILIVALTFVTIVFTANLDSTITFSADSYAKAEGKAVDIKVASYNVKGGYNTKDNLTTIRNNLKDKGIDIVGVQEVDSDKMLRSSSVKCITTLTAETYTNSYFAATNSLFLGGNYGIMTMSSHSLLEASHSYLPLPNRWFMLTGEPRVVIRSVVNIDGVDVAFYNTHLSFENGVKMPNGDDMRDAQLKYILNTMNSDPCQYRVLVGDFNILSFDELSLFNEGGSYNMINNSNTNHESYRGDDVTFKCLDNIIYSSNMQLVDEGMMDNDLSDHNMLYATLRIEG